MEDVKTHFLYPSSLFASNEPHIVSTILGSCVAVCLFDATTKIGGINHYMLPFWNGQGLASPKYGNIAIERLLEKMIALGCKKSNIRAKVFGGGEVIETNIAQFKIGQRNIELAMEALDDLKIPIVAKSVGGKLGRKIEFNTETGEVKQKYIEKT
ncbi:MAG: chemotaxis protein CheD [Tenuifilaceae bacterium]|nr:chemotaxis protein CheD [Bacteroidales bacterium]MDI9516760.1 chemotaxis protein CheD [Bacteroidota bacterium]NLH56122.1 chemotaxis protein CheD [Rikenellaceae bacterium]HNV82057.1 chemotaxis protein CheD [Tenuifilaceae bacterium]MZP83144.1 chemotaxis protein CheD [Bacteroidales bacterium]